MFIIYIYLRILSAMNFADFVLASLLILWQKSMTWIAITIVAKISIFYAEGVLDPPLQNVDKLRLTQNHLSPVFGFQWL